MKVALVGNCQINGLRQAFASVDGEFDLFEVWRLSPAQITAFDTDRYDRIVAMVLAPAYGPLSHGALMAGARLKTTFIHNLHFDGLIPDCVYCGPLGRRLMGPMGSYHGRIVIDSYLVAASVEATVKRLAEGSAWIDARSAFRESMAELERREQAVDVPWCADLDDMLRSDRGFWTFNHPNIAMLQAYADRVAHLTFGVGARPADQLADDLRLHGVWPVYPWVKAALDLSYGGDRMFVTPSGHMSFQTFVEASFSVYDANRDRVLVL